MNAVFNTSPLIFLSKLGRLAKAVSLFDRVLIPQAVMDELSAKKSGYGDIVKIVRKSASISLVTPHTASLVSALHQRLGLGESEAITLAIENNGYVVILDDAAARKDALRLGLKIKGTLGLLKKMRDDGLIKKVPADKLYRDLLKIGFRIDRAVFDEIVA